MPRPYECSSGFWARTAVWFRVMSSQLVPHWKSPAGWFSEHRAPAGSSAFPQGIPPHRSDAPQAPPRALILSCPSAEWHRTTSPHPNPNRIRAPRIAMIGRCDGSSIR
jgi:hypothetical protein